MYKNVNAKVLILVIIALMVVLALFQFTSWFKNDRTFKENLVAADTSKVTKIEISSIKNNSRVALYRKNIWYVKVNEKEYPADQNDVQSILDQLVKLKPMRVAGNAKTSWTKYEVTDSTAIRVSLSADKNILSDMLIGKFSYQQATRKMTSYVRIYGEPMVYAVDGFLSMSFNRDANSFRSKAILSGTPEQWTKFSFTYPADSSFQLSKTENSWTVDGIQADSASVTQFINDLRNLSGNEFADSLNQPNMPPANFKLVIEGNNFKAFEVACFEINNKKYIQTSINPGSYFKADQIFEKLFKGRNKFYKLKLNK